MARQGSATPGVYASERSRAVAVGLVGTTSIFPGREPAWYSSTSSVRNFFVIGEKLVAMISAVTARARRPQGAWAPRPKRQLRLEMTPAIPLYDSAPNGRAGTGSETAHQATGAAG